MTARYARRQPPTRAYWAAELVQWLLWQPADAVNALTPATLPKRFLGVGLAKRAEILGAEQARRAAA